MSVGERDFDRLADGDLCHLQGREDRIDDVIEGFVVHVALENVGRIYRHLCKFKLNWISTFFNMDVGCKFRSKDKNYFI